MTMMTVGAGRSARRAIAERHRERISVYGCMSDWASACCVEGSGDEREMGSQRLHVCRRVDFIVPFPIAMRVCRTRKSQTIQEQRGGGYVLGMVAKRIIPSATGVDFDDLNHQGVHRRRTLLGFEAVRTLGTKALAPVCFSCHLWSSYTLYMDIPSLSFLLNT
jgi:hypothetical protein